MYAQFFGSYLLNKNLITTEQLAKALDDKKKTKIRLGVLAINSGLMTGEQVESVHQEQTRQDKRFGEIAIEMGYLTDNDVDTLLSSQPSDYLLLGQALVNNGVISNVDFQNAIKEYNEKHQISQNDISNDQNEKLYQIISEFYNFESYENAKKYIVNISLLFNNIIRFIGDDFTPLEAFIIKEIDAEYIVKQNICGSANCHTAIEGEEFQYLKFASRFAEEEITEIGEYAHASVGEFLNLHNGLFTVNMSNDLGIELTLEPQEYIEKTNIKYQKPAFCLPFSFSFGLINFIISI